jgi:hypothetical protein
MDERGIVAAPGGRRRRANVAGGRSARHYVKVSPVEEARLVCLAADRRITVARLLVESTLAGGAGNAARDAAMLDELLMLGRLLGRVGVNVNQIARATNATGEAQPETAGVMDAVVRVCARLDALVSDLGASRAGRIPRPRAVADP